MARAFEPLPDAEEAEELVEHAVIDRDVRTAHRRAGMALVFSGLVFAGAVAFAFCSPASNGSLPSRSVEHGSAVGFNQMMPQQMPMAAMDQLDQMNDFGDEQGMPPSRYILAGPAILRRTGGHTGLEVQHLPVGTRVYPLKHRAGWIEVIVGRAEGVNPAFGWLPLKLNGVDLLEKDLTPPPQLAPSSASPEEIHQKWDHVRSQNAKLKESLGQLQASLRNHFMENIAHKAGIPGAGQNLHNIAHGAGARGVGQSFQQPAEVSTSQAPTNKVDVEHIATAAKGAVDVKELNKDAAVIEQDVTKELQEPPKQIIKDVESLFR